MAMHACVRGIYSSEGLVTILPIPLHERSDLLEANEVVDYIRMKADAQTRPRAPGSVIEVPVRRVHLIGGHPATQRLSSAL